MYKGNTTDKASNDRPSARYNDSKYVADILSSMANGEPAAPGYTLPAYASSVATGTTPTLTPTTLANIEQTFIELQSVPVSSAGQDGLHQSGFVPPIVDPISGSDQTPGGTPDRYDYSDSDQDSWMGPPSKTSLSDNGKVVTSNPSYCASRGRKRRSREDDLDDPSISPEEAERRRVRRERNKVAAAKCRQRRVDHTNRLINETDKLEDEKSSLETEIQTLQQQKDQLEFILQAHKPLCKAEGIVDKTRVKTEFRDKDCTSNGTTLPSIKREMPDFMDDYGSHCALKMDRQRPSHNTCSRPSSLSLQPKSVSQSLPSVSLSSATGISITTPSSGFYTFDMDAHSGLTPLGAPSCGSQIQRSSVDSSPDGVNSPTLISL